MFIMQMSPPLSHGLIIMDRLFLRFFNAVFFINVNLLYVFWPVVLMEPNTCSTRVKKLIKVWL